MTREDRLVYEATAAAMHGKTVEIRCRTPEKARRVIHRVAKLLDTIFEEEGVK